MLLFLPPSLCRVPSWLCGLGFKLEQILSFPSCIWPWCSITVIETLTKMRGASFCAPNASVWKGSLFQLIRFLVVTCITGLTWRIPWFPRKEWALVICKTGWKGLWNQAAFLHEVISSCLFSPVWKPHLRAPGSWLYLVQRDFVLCYVSAISQCSLWLHLKLISEGACLHLLALDSFLINKGEGQGPSLDWCCSLELAPSMHRHLALRSTSFCKCGLRTRNICTPLVHIRTADWFSCPQPTESTYILTRTPKCGICVGVWGLLVSWLLSVELTKPLCWNPVVFTFASQSEVLGKTCLLTIFHV